MLDFITHPAAVHVPLAIAVLHPVAFAATWLAIARFGMPARAWLFPLGACLIQVGATGLAYVTGVRDRVLSAGDPAILDGHQELALYFAAIWGVLLAGHLALVVARSPRVKTVWATVSLIALVAQTVLAILLGRLGGQLMPG